LDFENRPEAKNLMTIYAALSGQSMDQVFDQHGGKTFSEFKKILTDVAVEHLAPITSRMNDLLAAPDSIDEILRIGAEKANDIAAPNVSETMNIMGFWK
jgi:tryptophanyl-tRNA synthetase